ncbi:MAG: flagellar basal body L-ring protein FlgH [Thiotrichales bacterium]|nr:flagellar basal body L-ring protein FlgH [Thiotrichales bacterium]
MILLLSLTLAGGCQSKLKRDPGFASVRPPLPPAAPEANGAIYQKGFDMRIFEDVKARRVGDILVVQLVENTGSTKSNETTINKSTTTDIDNPTIFRTSPEFDLPGFFPLANTSDVNLDTNLSSTHTFSGDSSSDQSNSLNGTIAVSVVEVLPNGNMIVRGEKRMTLNQGNEYIRISGIVRPTDVLANNTVLSTQIADATISYTGEGAGNDSNVIGWLARFFVSAVLPF